MAPTWTGLNRTILAFTWQSIIAGGHPATAGLEAHNEVVGNDLNCHAGNLIVLWATLQISLAASVNLCVVCILGAWTSASRAKLTPWWKNPKKLLPWKFVIWSWKEAQWPWKDRENRENYNREIPACVHQLCHVCMLQVFYTKAGRRGEKRGCHVPCKFVVSHTWADLGALLGGHGRTWAFWDRNHGGADKGLGTSCLP